MSSNQLKHYLHGKEALSHVLSFTKSDSTKKTDQIRSKLIVPTINSARNDIPDLLDSHPFNKMKIGGNCLGISRWFIKNYLETTFAFADSKLHMYALGSIFKKGSTRESFLLQFLSNQLYSQFSNILVPNPPTFLITQSGKTYEESFQQKISSGIYLVLTDNHACVYIKNSETEIFFFDPNIGVIELNPKNQEIEIKTLLKKYLCNSGIKFYRQRKISEIPVKYIRNEPFFLIDSHIHQNSTLYLSSLKTTTVVSSGTVLWKSPSALFGDKNIPELLNIQTSAKKQKVVLTKEIITCFESLAKQFGYRQLGIKTHTIHHISKSIHSLGYLPVDFNRYYRLRYYLKNLTCAD